MCGVSVLGETAGEHPLNGDECFENCLHDNQRKKLKHFGQSSKKNFWQFGEQVGNRKTIFILNFLYSGGKILFFE